MSAGLVQDKRIVVTGAGSNIGEVYATRLAAEGARVAVVDIDGAGAERVAKEIAAAGGEALWFRADITDPGAVEATVASVVAEWGGIDVLVNNAAIYAGLDWVPPHMIDLDEWDRVMSVNVKGPFVVARAVAPVMIDQGGGSIVNISSTTALFGPPFLVHYAASKGAVLTLTRSLARCYGDAGVRVNAIAPGLVWDKASTDAFGSEAVGDTFVQNQALKRRQMPDDLVGTVLYLASDQSRATTGQTIVVDCGLMMH